MDSNAPRWSMYVGIYMFLVSVIILLPLGVIANTLIEILGFPAGFTPVLMPGSGGVIAAGVWWVVVERRERYTYLLGGAVGLLTAIIAVGFWLLLLAIVYGPEIVLAAGVVISFVLAVLAPVAFIAVLPMMHVRRHFMGG